MMLDFLGVIRGYDLMLFDWLNSWVFWRPWADALIIFRAEFLGYWMLVGLLAFGVFAFYPRFLHLRKKNLEMICTALASALIARFGAAEIIRFFYDRPRPFEVVDGVQQLIFRDGGGSFPSGHATFYFAVAAVVSRYYPKTSIIFFLAALNLSLARIQTGLHWPSDILGSAIIGSAVGLLTHSAVKKFLKPKTPR